MIIESVVIPALLRGSNPSVIVPHIRLRNVCSVQHVSQYFLCIFQPFSHLCIFAIQCRRKGILTSFSLQVDVGHQFLLTRQYYFCSVSEVHLHYLIAKPEHDGMLCFHPFLHIAKSLFFWFRNFNLIWISIEIVAEVLQEGDFLLKFSFLGIFSESIGWNSINFLASLFLNVFEGLSSSVKNDFGWIIEINSCWAIRKKISETILGGIINPFFHMNFRIKMDSFFYA